MDIRRSNKNFKDGKLKCFNCNKYKHMVKECRMKKNKRPEHASNATKKDISPEIAKESKQ